MKSHETAVTIEENESGAGLPAAPPWVPTRMARNQAVDALRGLIMIIMALDHTRELFHSAAMTFQPEDLARTTVPLFFTRWITHICAPVFFFTAGLGAYFRLGRGHADHPTGFLVKRGLWLVLLELTALRFVLNFSLTTSPIFLTILWALGWSMVALGFLSRLPIRLLAVGALLVIALHNLADSVSAASLGAAGPLWNVLHQPGFIPLDAIGVVVAYPLVPWFAVMAAGFCFGPIMNLDARARRGRMVSIGLGMILAFLALRAVNVYGDPVRWSADIPGKTLLSFLRCTKYPPSLDFLLVTLGPALLLLAGFDRIDRSFSGFWRKNPLLVFGRVPLFYFLIHFLLIHLLTIPFAYFRYGKVGFLLNAPPSLGGRGNLYPSDYGYSLLVVYGIWILVVVIMFPLCVWFSRLKERRRDWWLSYI
jgi:uncharacterized membrane protein